MAVVDLVVGHNGDAVAAQPTMARLAAFQHPGRVTAIQVRFVPARLLLHSRICLRHGTGRVDCRSRLTGPPVAGPSCMLQARRGVAASCLTFLFILSPIQASSLGGGEVVLVAAGADGGISRLRMHVPLIPGSQPDAIQVGQDWYHLL